MDGIEEVKEYVLKNKVLATPGVVCVDGRYDRKFAGMLARPGGNFKGILVMLALRNKLKLTIGKVVDMGVEAIEKMGVTFNMHTDAHADPFDLEQIGCGHIAKAADPKYAKDYEVDPRDVKLALVYLRLKLEGEKFYSMTELKGDHKEIGVLVITGKKYSVSHYDTKQNEMYFVYDKARDDDFNKKLFDNLNLKNLSFKEFQKVGDIQLNATLHLLAKGLPIYEVNADKDEPEIRFIGKVD